MTPFLHSVRPPNKEDRWKWRYYVDKIRIPAFPLIEQQPRNNSQQQQPFEKEQESGFH